MSKAQGKSRCKVKCLILLAGLVVIFGQQTQAQVAQLSDSQKVSFAAIPFPTYNQSFGFGLGILASVFYRLNSEDTISPPSSTGAFAFFTTNNTWIGMGYQQLYWKEDKNRAIVAAAAGDIYFQTYFEVLPGGFVNYSSDFKLLYGEYTRRVYKDWFIGPAFLLSKMSTEFGNPGAPQPLEDERAYNALGLHTQWDSRDNIFNPNLGWNIEYRFLFYDEAFGSNSEYYNNSAALSKYIRLDKKSLLAANVQINVAAGDSVPFEQQNIVGGRVLRGYTNGKYRENQVYSLQAEYRWNFYKGFGAVFFGGAAWATDGIDHLSKNGTLPAAGFGLRWMMIPKERINIGVDVAWGKEDSGIYFRIGEAF